jgi:hypothetical protein
MDETTEEVVGLDALIEALTIFRKYGNPIFPTHCEHDILYICGINEEDVSGDDKTRLDELGFFVDEEEGGFASYRFGSA